MVKCPETTVQGRWDFKDTVVSESWLLCVTLVYVPIRMPDKFTAHETGLNELLLLSAFPVLSQVNRHLFTSLRKVIQQNALTIFCGIDPKSGYPSTFSMKLLSQPLPIQM